MGSKGGTTVMLPQAQTQTSSVAPNPVALQAYSNVVGQAQGLQGQNLGFAPQQQQAFNEIGGLQGAANPYLQQAQNFIGGGVGAANQLIQSGANAGSPQNFGQNIQQYMNPYINDVVRSTMANINETNAQQQSQLTGNAIAQGAMGGNRVGVAGAELARQQDLTNNSTLANILQAGYGQAGQNLFQGAGMQMQGGSALGGLGNQAGGLYAGLGSEAMSTGLQGANALLQAGGMQQALPYQQLAWLSGIVGNQGPLMGQTGTQSSMGYTSQYAPQPNMLNSILGAGVAGAGLLARARGGVVGKAHGGGLGEYDPSYDDYGAPIGGGFGAIPEVRPSGAHGLQLPQFQGLQQPHQQQKPEQGRSPTFGDFSKAGRGLRSAYDRYGSSGAEDFSGGDTGVGDDILEEARGGRVRGYDDGGTVDYDPDVLARNSQWSVPAGSAGYQTPLSANEQQQFNDWVRSNNVPYLASPTADYDMPGYWKSLNSGDGHAASGLNTNDSRMHFTDYFKTPYHQSFSAESKFATSGAPSWNAQDQLVAPNGKIIFDERARRGLGGLVRSYDDGGEVIDDTGGLGATEDPTFARMLKQESGNRQFDKDGNPLTSPKGAVGIAQLMPGTAPEAFALAGMPWDENRYRNDPAANRKAGAAYYQAQLEHFGDPEKAAAAYNAGPGRVSQALARAEATGADWRSYLPQETKGYLANVTGGGLGAINAASPINVADSGGLNEGRSAYVGGVSPPDAEPGFLERLGVPKISPDTKQALIAAGLGMMASKSHWLGPAIGEGGLQGVKTYYENQKNTRENALNQSTINYRQGELANRAGLLGVAQQRNRLTAEQLRQSGINIGSEVTTRAGQLGIATREQNLKERQADIQINAAQESARALREYYNSQSPGSQASSSAAPVTTDGGVQPLQQPSPAGGVGGGTGSVSGGGTGGVVPPNHAAVPQGAPASRLTSESDAAFLDKMATAHERAAMAAGLQGGQVAMEAHQKDAQSYRTAAEHARTVGIGTDAASGRSVPLPGAPETAYQLAGAKSKGEAAGKAPYEIKEVAGPNGELRYQSVADIVDQNGKAQATPIVSTAGAGTPTSGPPQPNLVLAKQPAVMAERQKAIATNEQKMTESYQVRQIARERMETLADILSRYQTGAFAENKASWVAKLRAVGIPVTNKDTANPAAFEQFTKNAMKNVFSDVHDMGGKVLVAEITGLSRATANPDLQPEANKAILGQALGLLNYEDQYHDDYFNWKRQNPYAADTSAFDTEWVKAHPVKEFVKAATGKIGALGEQIPAPADRQNGQVYSIPANRETGAKAHQRQWINGGWAPKPYQGNQ